MSRDLALITCGLDLREEHIAAAIGSREETKSLLTRLSVVSAPDTGVAKVLLVYARMATTACDWIDGDLCIDLMNEADATSIHAFTELGGGMRERLFAAMTFRAPLNEFSRSIGRVPHMISPLAMRSTTPRRIRLSATELVRRTTIPPPPISISVDSLFMRASSLAPFAVRDGLLAPPLPVASVGTGGSETGAPASPSGDGPQRVRGGDRPKSAEADEDALPDPPLNDVDGNWED